MPFFQHLFELKKVFFLILLQFITIFCIIFFYYEQCIFIFLDPLLYLLEFNYFIVTDLSGFFTIKIMISLYLSIFYIIIFSIFYVFSFFSPGLYKSENLYIYIYLFIFISYIFIFCFFLYKILIPYAWKFLISFQKSTYTYIYHLSFEPQLIQYMSFIFQIFLWTSFIFFYLIILIVLLYLNIIKKEFIIEYRKLCYLKIFILATIFSPPDILSQILLGLFFICCLEILLLFYMLFEKLKN